MCPTARHKNCSSAFPPCLNIYIGKRFQRVTAVRNHVLRYLSLELDSRPLPLATTLSHWQAMAFAHAPPEILARIFAERLGAARDDRRKYIYDNRNYRAAALTLLAPSLVNRHWHDIRIRAPLNERFPDLTRNNLKPFALIDPEARIACVTRCEDRGSSWSCLRRSKPPTACYFPLWPLAQ